MEVLLSNSSTLFHVSLRSSMRCLFIILITEFLLIRNSTGVFSVVLMHPFILCISCYFAPPVFIFFLRCCNLVKHAVSIHTWCLILLQSEVLKSILILGVNRNNRNLWMEPFGWGQSAPTRRNPATTCRPHSNTVKITFQFSLSASLFSFWIIHNSFSVLPPSDRYLTSISIKYIFKEIPR